MNYYFITGTSKGIGKALCVKVLDDPSNLARGLSRSEGIIHPRYKHFISDLSEINKIPEVAGKFFELDVVPQKVVLINNAGLLGEVGYFGSVNDKSLIDVLTVNVIAPAVLMNSFMRTFKGSNSEKIIINISSGAGSHPVDGWGGYCSSKAAINMMSEVAAVENELKTDDTFKIFSVAPGVVDTEMQAKIRHVKRESFSDVDRFIKLKETGELTDPEITAQKILYLVSNSHKFRGVMQDVRKL